MKKNRLFMMAGALCAALGLGSCSNEMDEVAVPAEGATRTVTLTVSLPDRGADTRTAYAADAEGTGLKVIWADGDELTAFGQDLAKSTTFKLTSGAGETTATFTGELPEDVVDEGIVEFYYPKFKTEVIDGETHYICPDYTAQDGTLAGLSEVDAFVLRAQYSDGKLSVMPLYTYRYTSFLHFAKDTKVASTGGTATFTISNANAVYDLTAGEFIKENIVVDKVTVNPDGKLADDVYIAFEKNDYVTPTLTIAVGSEKKVYSLDRDFKAEMYNISDMSKLTVAPQVGMVIGSDGKYYENKAAAEAVDGVKAEAMIAYVGTEAEGATHGLAIALEDASSSTVKWENAASTVSSWASAHAVSGGTWRLPSAYDWQRMLIGCSGTDTYAEELSDGLGFANGPLIEKLKAAGGDECPSGSRYWSSTEYKEPDSEEATGAWGYYFSDSKIHWLVKTGDCRIRAVLAF